MRRRFVSLCGVCIVLFMRASVAGGQVVPSAQTGGGALSFGTGLSSWDPDFGSARMLGITVWTDYHPPLPASLDGLGLEAQARDVSWHGSSSPPAILKQQTIGGGPIYNWNRFRNARPYGKFLAYFGGMDFRIPNSTYTHDTRTVVAPGGGLQFRAYQYLWVRVDYEYQIWQPMILPNHRPTPQGFTIGLAWNTRGVRKPTY
jgi:hypothetical protein